jgi:lysophospholipase L1-like esterase
MGRRDTGQRTVRVPARTDATGRLRGYVRLAALGDELAGVVPDGWAGLLADAIRQDHDLSFHAAATPGARVADVLHQQVADAVAHRAHVVLLTVGGHDVRCADWDAAAFRRDLLDACSALVRDGALLVLTRLPSAAGAAAQVTAANAALDEAHRRHGGALLDLAAHPGTEDAEFWSVPGALPSELGHQALLDEVAELLGEHGLAVATDLRSDLRTPHHASPMTTVTDYGAGRGLPLRPDEER